MDQLKVFLVTLSKVFDAECNQDELSQIGKFSTMINNRVSDCLIISSPLNECLQFSQNLAESLDKNWCVMRQLSNQPQLNYDTNSEKFQSYPEINPELFNPMKIELLNTLLETNNQHIIIVTDKEAIEGSEFQYRTRTGNNAVLCEIKKVNAGANNGNALKVEKTSFKNCLRTEIVRTFGAFLPRIQKMFKRVKKSANNLNQSAETVADMLEIPESDESYYENQLVYISSQLEKGKKVFGNLESTFKICQTLAENQIDPQTFKGKIKICKFAFEQHTNSWILTIKSNHTHKIPNLSIYCVETRQKIHSFKLIQGCSKVSASIIGSNQEFYHKNLVAVVNGVLISEIFTVFPYKLRAINLNLGYQGIELKVENCSMILYENVFIASSYSKDVIKLSTQLGYTEKIIERVLLDLSQNNELFLVSGNVCLSNSITISSKEGDN